MGVQTLEQAAPAQAAITIDAAPASVWLTRSRAAAPYLLIALVAVLSRLRYAVWAYHDNFGSGDAHAILLRSYFISRGQLEPPANVGVSASMFVDPPLLPMTFAALAKAGFSLEAAPLWFGTLVTTVALLALYGILRRAFDDVLALVAVTLVALIPRFAFDSTEPDKVAYVVSLFLFALWCVYAAADDDDRPLRRSQLIAASGVFAGLMIFAHNTGYLFLPVWLVALVAVPRFQWRRVVTPAMGAALTIPLFFATAYVLLNDHYDRGVDVSANTVTVAAPEPASPEAQPPDDAPTAPPVEAPSANRAERHRFVPQPVQNYWDTLSGLAENRFRDSAWDEYFSAIRTQATTPVYVLAMAGWLIGAAMVVMRRKYEMLPLLAWMLVVTVGFAIQHPSFSHSSRYPSYVTPAFAIMAAFVVVTAARWVASFAARENRAMYAAAAAAPILAFIAVTYIRADDPGVRRLYEPHVRFADYVAQEQIVQPDAQLLYMGWPSMSLYMLERDDGVSDSVHAFGWGTQNLDTLASPQYISEHHIRYYAFDHTGNDYAYSAPQILDRLKKNFELQPVRTFCAGDASTCANVFVTLYELLPKG